jgi:drug/metabolite transporter (DMT)-like permease
LARRVGWRRWAAIGVGFIGVLIILQPGFGVFRIEAIVPLIAALMFALYGLLTRYAARQGQHRNQLFLDWHSRIRRDDHPSASGSGNP